MPSRRKEIEALTESNGRAAWIILAEPDRYAGLPMEWARLWVGRHGMPKEPKGYREAGLEDRLAEKREKRERRRIAGRRQRWRARPWKVSKKGNPYTKVRGGYHIVLFRQGGAWAIRAMDQETEFGQFSKKQYQTMEEAKDGAFDALLFLESRRTAAHPSLVVRQFEARVL